MLNRGKRNNTYLTHVCRLLRRIVFWGEGEIIIKNKKKTQNFQAALTKAAVLVEAPQILYFLRAISAMKMSTDVSQLGVAPFPSF